MNDKSINTIKEKVKKLINYHGINGTARILKLPIDFIQKIVRLIEEEKKNAQQ